MTRRRDIDRHVTALTQISGVMGSMKKLAQMEGYKVERLLLPQRMALANIRRAAADFHSTWPLPIAPPTEETAKVYVIWGSERGFCGDFNQRLVSELERLHLQDASDNTVRIVIGRRCAAALQQRVPADHVLPGAGIVDEIPHVLGDLLEILAGLAPDALNVLSHHSETGAISQTRVLPPELQVEDTLNFRTPILLNLKPEAFLRELLDHYLFAILHELAYESLLAECRYRMQHLESAGRRIDERIARLKLRRNTLRQEEITEELEIILLNAPG